MQRNKLVIIFGLFSAIALFSLPAASKTEPFSLEANGSHFPARLTLLETDNSSKALILLPDFSLHPDGIRFVSPLREALPKAPWGLITLSLASAPKAETLSEEQPPFFQLLESLLDQCILKLNEKGIEEYLLVAHGQVAFWVAHWLKKTQKSGYKGLILMNLRLPTEGVTRESLEDFLPLGAMPLLDLYGPTTHLEENFLAPLRRKAQDSSEYKGLELIGADHFFSHQEAELVKRVHAWLEDLDKTND